MPQRSSSSARIFAPAALAICALAVVFIVGGSLGGDDSDGGSTPVTATDQATSTPTTPQRRQRTTYTIKAGDTLGAIAEQTGVQVETLQELNPELDPQALIAGQKIQLR